MPALPIAGRASSGVRGKDPGRDDSQGAEGTLLAVRGDRGVHPALQRLRVRDLSAPATGVQLAGFLLPNLFAEVHFHYGSVILMLRVNSLLDNIFTRLRLIERSDSD
uniref:Uncharacterized protein n=2 Tax=Anguilla anguilla TaxID=7936 RepID=A0A0E9SGB3_ANGAN